MLWAGPYYVNFDSYSGENPKLLLNYIDSMQIHLVLMEIEVEEAFLNDGRFSGFTITTQQHIVDVSDNSIHDNFNWIIDIVNWVGENADGLWNFYPYWMGDHGSTEVFQFSFSDLNDAVRFTLAFSEQAVR